MPTSLSKEKEEQKKWHLRPEYQRLGKVFSSLIQNEFLSSEQHTLRMQKQLTGLLNYCAVSVPYYQDLFKKHNFDYSRINGVEDLLKLPLLDRQTIQQQPERLHATKLPRGFAATGVTRTSGTSGQPVEILQTSEYSKTFQLMKQREYRWFRFDPAGKLAFIRNVGDLPRKNDRQLHDNETVSANGWFTVGRFFQTGPWLGLSDTTSMEDQVSWLEKHQPNYLLGQSARVNSWLWRTRENKL